MNHLTFEISFRFRQLNKMQVMTLSREIEGVSYTEDLESETTKPRSFVALVALTSEHLEAITMFYVRQSMNVDNCDILVTVPHTAATSFTLPEIVNQMLKHIDCPISFLLLNEGASPQLTG
ncbi:MAG: hypothetical protein KKF22_19415 [Gammaproteobacteria bacterium]|nr:hypothetical protein [Gammaproteobacteria bacterium]